MRKVYVVGDSGGYARWMEASLANRMEDADFVVFTGGEDVHPDLYGEPMHPYTGSNLTRDRYEAIEFNEALKLGKPMVGICRGSQFLCVMNGGHLVQHQQNPHFVHDIDTWDGKTIQITSTHHQAAFPYNMSKDRYNVIGWTKDMLPFHEDGNREEMHPEKECEIVHYPKGKCLGIQGHPEMMDLKHPTIGYLRDLLNKFLSNTLIASSNEPDSTKKDTQPSYQVEASIS